jgi:peptide/nickel transport system substrate-binding protein
MTRRRFVASSAAAGFATAVIACGEGKRRPAGLTPAPTATAAAGRAKRGGILRAYTFDALSPETFDPHAVAGGPIVSVHSAVFSKLLRYQDEGEGTIAPDLAEALPEQPDELTYVLKIREGVTFHDTPGARAAFPTVAGRQLTPDDVKYSIERQIAETKAPAARFGRAGQLGVIERIDTLDGGTIRIRLKAPTAPFPAFLAGRHAYVLPREVIDLTTGEVASPGAMLGSGPFALESFEAGFAVKLRRNAGWFSRADAGGAARPYLDGYDAFLSPQHDVFQAEAFNGRAVDTTEFLDANALDHARTTNLADIVLDQRDAGAIVATRLLVDRAPFNDARVRRALHLGIDRRAIATLLYPQLRDEASARLSGPIAPASRWAIAEEDLLRRAGYAEDRAEALREARQLWVAATGGAPAETIRGVFSGVPRTVTERAMPAMQRQLSDVFGVTLTGQVDPSGGALMAAGLRLNREGAAEGTIAFTFALEDGGVDLDDWLYGAFRSGEPGNTYRLQDATLDGMLDAQRGEFDPDARKRLGVEIQEYLLANVNARIEYAAPVRRRLSWGYVRDYELPMWHGSDFGLADTWLDDSHPAWIGRPA